MKKLLLGLFSFVSFFGFTIQTQAQSYGWDWDIDSFHQDITINQDSTVEVKEQLIVDFTREPHHGIIRKIPVSYTDKYGNKLNVRLTNVKVTNANNQIWNYEVSRNGDYLNIKIGDADSFVTTMTTYNIDYTLQRVITSFDDHKELYWNVTGTEWDVPILKSSAQVNLPSTQGGEIKAICYTGSFGSSEKDCNFETGTSTVKFASNQKLNSREGLSIVVGFPKDLINSPSLFQEVSWFLMDNWGYLIPLLTLAYLVYIWQTRGRDPKTNRDTVVPLYQPPANLGPSEVGTVIDEQVDMRDISAAIIDLAIRGYFKIIEKKEKKLLFDKTEFELEKLRDFEKDGADLKPYELKILEGIFDSKDKVNINDLNNKFYKNLEGIKKNIYDDLVKKGIFPTSPEKVRTTYYTIGIVLLVATFSLAGPIIVFLNLSVAVSTGISGILFLLFAKAMPAKTKKGVETYYQILGLEEFIKTAETDRIKWQEKENIFEKLLPYAMSLSIAEKWTKAFEKMYKTPPNWYQSTDPNFMNNFNTYYFLDKLNHLTNNLNTSMTSMPRSSGSSSWSGGSGFSGGFSGGGFGGGGGSSW